ncbi:MAG: TetR/AcrR family transcriptional regulator [Symploca sp. SIO1C4]|uniref:TetR/AcrR family transcriptional regulator n=1 Tax=Symploca sp. SIO1C4 TaxID=2607765 RepID=A0A6B3NHV6_9CYAN|nr:TetR/AcrR family transcriptional regulator [Symploca sp. SIO1C4]
MARHKEFDREDVLNKAMEVFWCYGYQATSVQELVESMGINRGSLYDTFGDKNSLFQAALAHYNETVVTKAIAHLEAPGAAKAAIVNHFYSLVNHAVADSQRKGCLLTNSAVELCSHDLDAATRISANLQRVENAFKKALVRAQEKEEISSQHDINALASFLTCTLQGLQVISKVNPDPEVLQKIAEVALSVLK